MRRRSGGSPSSESSYSAKESEPSSNNSKRNEEKTAEEKSEAMLTATDDSDLKLTAKLPEYILKETRTLEGVSFYHGMAARDLIETKMTRVGDYLVRKTDNRTKEFEFILSFYNKKRIHSHLTMRSDPEDRKWMLGVMKDSLKFPSIVDLINHYKAHPLGAGFHLKRGISKGIHLISHDRIFYDTKTDGIGSGNFSDVFRGKLELENCSVKVALKNSKILDEMMDETKNANASKIKKEMIQEAEVMSQLRHTNITSFFGIASDRVPILLVIEYCNGGTLESHLVKNKEKIKYPECMLYVHDCAAGLKYIQSMSITHRDIAARNCLISVNGFVKLSDFGLGLKIDRKELSLDSAQNFPARWMAPESVQTPAKFNKQSDMWSMGILVWEIFSDGSRPYGNMSNEDIKANVIAGKPPEMPKKADEHMRNVMKKCFRLNSSERPTANMFYNEIHVYCKDRKCLTLDGITINNIEGVRRERVEHWDGYIPQVIVFDKNGKEKEWINAPSEMLATVVLSEKNV